LRKRDLCDVKSHNGRDADAGIAQDGGPGFCVHHGLSTAAPANPAAAQRSIDLPLLRLTVGDYRRYIAVSRAAATAACLATWAKAPIQIRPRAPQRSNKPAFSRLIGVPPDLACLNN